MAELTSPVGRPDTTLRALRPVPYTGGTLELQAVPTTEYHTGLNNGISLNAEGDLVVDVFQAGPAVQLYLSGGTAGSDPINICTEEGAGDDGEVNKIGCS